MTDGAAGDTPAAPSAQQDRRPAGPPDEEADMADPARARRLADRIKVVVAETLDKRIKDPRLGFVTLTDARVTNDLQHATVFWTVYGGEEERDGTAAALESARGLLRAEVGKQTGMRLTPTLEFVLDGVPEAASRIDDVLAAARARDAEIAAAAVGAQPAGDPDPYKTPRAAQDDLDDVDGEDQDGEDQDGEDQDGHGEDGDGPTDAGAVFRDEAFGGEVSADDLGDGSPELPERS
jgi:ribosome-binding factor A